MPRGQRPKPAHLKLVTGNPGRRRIKVEPATRALGSPPAALLVAQHAIWQQLVADAPEGVLRASDSPLVELTVRLLSQVRAGDTRVGLMTELRHLLGEIGCSPSSRARLAVAPPPAARNPFDDV